MRFQLNDDHWALDALTPAEWHLIAELPMTASGDSFQKESRERLYPPPVSPDSLADEQTLESVEDWDELVKPEMETIFQQARVTVEKDLDQAEKMSMEDYFHADELEALKGTLPDLRRVVIPNDHTDAWYSTLNQARLLMNEEYDLASSEERMMSRQELQENVDQDRLLLFAQYELYSAIQGMLVDHVMDHS